MTRPPRFLLALLLSSALLPSTMLATAPPQDATKAQAASASLRLSQRAELSTQAMQDALKNDDLPAAREAAATRLADLRALLEIAPTQVPALLLSPEAAQAAAVSLGDAVETYADDLELPLSIYHFDDFDNQRTWDEHVVVWEGRRLDLFAVEGLADLSNNSRVRIERAVRIDDALLALSPVRELPRAKAKANAYTSARVALLMVNFSDEPGTPWTKAQVEAALATNTRWYDEVSHGTQTTTYTVFGWYSLPLAQANCPYQAIETEGIKAAQAAGVNLSGFNVVAFAFPRISSCSWAGLGGGGNYWLNGNISLRVIAHELGHVLGLGHANSRRCPDGNYVTNTDCTVSEYGSPFDVMGAASQGHFHPGAKARLDYLRDAAGVPAIQTVTRTGEFDLLPYAAQAPGLKAIAIPRLGATNQTLHVEYRQRSGFDDSLGSRTGTRVQLTIGTNALIDLTPATTTWDDASLNLGAVFDEPDSGIRVQLLSADATKARVRVELDPCGRTLPMLEVVDQVPASIVGETRTVRVHVANMDDPAQCAQPTRFDLGVSPQSSNTPLPPNTSSNGGVLNIAPGASSFIDVAFAVPSSFTGSLSPCFEAVNTARPLLKTRTCRSLTVPSARLSRVSGDAQTTAVNQPFAQRLAVRVADASNAPVANALVLFAAPSGEASTRFSDSSRCTTNASGECSVLATARSQAGTYVARASLSTAVGEPQFSLTNTASSSPTADTTPDAAQFSARSGVPLQTPIVSASIRLGGVNVAVPVTVTSGEYSIGCTATFTSAAGTMLNGQTVCVRHLSSRFGGTATTTSLRVGAATWPFTSTTGLGGAQSSGGNTDTVPDAMSFADRSGVAVSSTVTSAAVTVSGINAASPVSVSGGLYSVGCTGTYGSSGGSISNGQTLCLRHTSAARASVTTETTVTVGGVAATFRSTTAASTRPQTADQFDLSGGWYEPTTSGQGLMIEVYDSASRSGQAPYLFAGWFTYTDRAGGVSEQDWYALEGTGTSNGRVFNLTIGRPVANVFDNGASAGAPVSLGTATLTFSSCREAVLDYAFSAGAGGRRGQVVLQRLLSDVSCDEGARVANAPRAFLNSGAWYEPATAGQGVLFEVNPIDRFVFGAWYTFAASGPADYRWFTFQKSNVDTSTGSLLNVPILETTGGRFDDGQATTSIRTVGSADLRFDDCGRGTMSYRFTAGELQGRTGEVPLQRVGPSPAECR